jgi:hypothetical protein
MPVKMEHLVRSHQKVILDHARRALKMELKKLQTGELPRLASSQCYLKFAPAGVRLGGASPPAHVRYRHKLAADYVTYTGRLHAQDNRAPAGSQHAGFEAPSSGAFEAGHERGWTARNEYPGRQHPFAQSRRDRPCTSPFALDMHGRPCPASWSTSCAPMDALPSHRRRDFPRTWSKLGEDGFCSPVSHLNQSYYGMVGDASWHVLKPSFQYTQLA